MQSAVAVRSDGGGGRRRRGAPSLAGRGGAVGIAGAASVSPGMFGVSRNTKREPRERMSTLLKAP